MARKQHSFLSFYFPPFPLKISNKHNRITTTTVEKQTKEILPAPLWRGCPSHVTSHYKHTHTHVTTWQCRSDRIWSCHRGDFHFGDCFSTQGAVRSRAIWKSNFSQTCTWQPFTFRHCYVIVLNKFETLLKKKHFFLIELQLAKGSSAVGVLLRDLVIISNHCRREVTGEVYVPHSAE